MKPKIAIDLGTSFTKIYKAQADVVLIEPTCIAIKNNNYKNPFACGQEAYSLIGKTPDNVKIIFPINNTDIIDNRALVALLNYFVSRVKKPFEKIQDVLLNVQCGTNRETIKKFENALIGAKLYNVCYAENPMLSVLGSTEELSSNKPNGVIDLGGAQTTVCVLTELGVISGASAEFGGNDLTNMIVKYIEDSFHLSITYLTAENLKIQLASLDEDDQTKMVVSGKDTLTGKQKTTPISAEQIYVPVKEYMDKIIKIANAILSSLHSDILAELTKTGIYLTGGGVKIYGISDYLSQALNIRTIITEEAEIASIIGAGKLVENNQLLEKLKLTV